VREKLPEGFQRAEFLFDHGFVDLVVQRAKLRETLLSLLRYMKANAHVDKAGQNGSSPLGRSAQLFDELIRREPARG
jgi:acetyl-CoA carboxylase carboxyl transferase subunit beta